jgi:hypothetical protein
MEDLGNLVIIDEEGRVRSNKSSRNARSKTKDRRKRFQKKGGKGRKRKPFHTKKRGPKRHGKTTQHRTRRQ